ncbi:MAG: V-type ATP synthase subunit D [Candidatus Omnitrophota bacterium]
MTKIKLTKGELKRQRDALKQYRRYLPTLQLKKQQLQIEILRQGRAIAEKRKEESEKRNAIEAWAGLLSDAEVNMKLWIAPRNVVTGLRNIAGVDIPDFERVEFEAAEYDFFTAPLWVDTAIDELKTLVSLRIEIETIERGIKILKGELRVTAQRVNLFEKVKIPEAEVAIRLIKIYIGDQMTNAVGRSKIAKKKIEQSVLEGVSA